MRIVAGKFRRRKLKTNPGLTTRPITDRVKEQLFARIDRLTSLDEWNIADVFAGTGTMGLEAISRGAAGCVFIEMDPRAHQLLRENVAMLELQDSTLCWKTDVLRSSFLPKNVDHLLPYNLIFFDPPYKMAVDLQPEKPLYRSIERLTRNTVSADDAWLMVRTAEGTDITLPQEWSLEDRFYASSMDIRIFAKQSADQSTVDNAVETQSSDD